MKKLKALIEKHNDNLEAMGKMLDTCEAEQRAFTEDEQKRYDELMTETRSLTATIRAAEQAEEMQMTHEINPAGQEGETRSQEAASQQEQAEARAFADYVLGRSAEQRAGEIQLTQGNNGTIVPTTIANRIITKVRDMVPFLRLADVISTNGKLSVPVYGEDATNYIKADYVDEGTDLTDNVGKFTTIDLTGYVVGALALVSNKLKDNTDLDVVGFIVNQVAEAMAEKLEKEFVNGTTGKITGILAATGGVTAASATAITYDELVNLKHALKQRFRGNACWIKAPSTYTELCKLKDGNKQPYFKEDEYKILGLPVIESDSMPAMAAGAKAIVLADLTGYTIKATKHVEITLLREKFATKNMIGVMSYGEYDGKITDSKKIAVLTMKAS